MRLRNPFAMECGVFKTNYAGDLALHYTLLAQIRMWLIIAAFFALPAFLDNYWLSVAIASGVAVIGALGLNILTGFTGQISIGNGAFLGVGAYTSAYLTTKMGIPFWIALPLAGLVTSAVGAIFGLPSARLKGLYLAIATLAAQVVIEFAIVHSEPITNGTRGIIVSRPAIGPYSLTSETSYYYLVLITALSAIAFAYNLFRSRIGRAFVAIRDRDLAAEVIGVDLFRHKIMAFALSSFYVGVAGALWGHYVQVVSPEHFTITASIEYLAMVIIGGLGSIMGAVYGAVFMTLLPILLRTVAEEAATVFPNIQALFLSLKETVFGATIILFLVFEPEGLAKLWKNIKDYFRLWPFSY